MWAVVGGVEEVMGGRTGTPIPGRFSTLGGSLMECEEHHTLIIFTDDFGFVDTAITGLRDKASLGVVNYTHLGTANPMGPGAAGLGGTVVFPPTGS